MSMTLSGSNGITFNDASTQSTGKQACKAWVNFNGTGTVAIRDSFNVSSITDNGTGAYTINFTTAMPNANYCASVAASGVVGVSDALFITTDMNGGARANPTTTSFSVSTYRFQAPVIDVEFVRVAVFSS